MPGKITESAVEQFFPGRLESQGYYFVSPELSCVAIAGGESDSRNKSIQDMFRMIGAGERQGFGIRKIIEGWKKFDWRIPHFEEKDKPSPRVIVTLSMLSLFPESAVQSLSVRYGNHWQQFSEPEKLALMLAFTEGAVTHARLSQFCKDHPRDLSAALQNLEKSGTMETTGQYRAKTYHITGHVLPTAEDVFVNTTNSGLNTTNSDPSPTNLDTKGRIVHKGFNAPFVDDISTLAPEFRRELEAIAELPRTKKRLDPETMKLVILELCRD